MEQRRNNSKKRQAMLDFLCATRSHPSAEAVYRALKPEIPELSLGTVYRNLQVLEQDGLVRCVCTVDGQARYDARTQPHAHCVCRRCRRVMDGDGVSAGELFSGLRFEAGFVPESYDLTVTGLCARCAQDADGVL